MATPQINSAMSEIRNQFQNIKQISGLEFDVGLPLKRCLLFVRLKLEASFPTVRPRIQVASNVVHPIIDNKKYIIIQELTEWSPKSKLLNVLNVIFTIFSQSPPVPDTESLPNFGEILNSWKNPIEDEQDIVEFVNSLEDLKKLVGQRDLLLEANLAKVKENLKKKEEYDRLISQHQSEITEVEDLTSQLTCLMKEVDQINRQYSQEKVVSKLREMELDFNKEAGDIQKAFMRKEIQIEDFVEQYQIPMRKSKLIQIAREGRG